MPGVAIVADISPITVDEAGGAAMMKTILLANPDIDVVLGADTVVLGALAALRAAGKRGQISFLAASMASQRRLPRLDRAAPSRRASALPLLSSATPWDSTLPTGWKARVFLRRWTSCRRALTLQNLDAYERDVADPGAVYRDPQKRDVYLKMYGNICFDTRDQYLSFPGRRNEDNNGRDKRKNTFGGHFAPRVDSLQRTSTIE